MNRMFKYGLMAVMTATMAPMAFSQAPDVPDNHWAARAVRELFREGILVGYPDGLYRGNRPASRYELAQALYAAYTRLKGMMDGLSSKVDSLEETINNMEAGTSGDHPITAQDVASMKNQLSTLQNQVNGMRTWGDDINALQRMATEFERELAEMGVDVETVKNDLSDLEDRVTALEEQEDAITISGDVNFLVTASHGDDDLFGLGPDGKIWGSADGDYDSVPTGLVRTLNVFHEIATRLSGEVNDELSWAATLVAGNILDSPGDGLGNYSTPTIGDSWDQNSWDLHIYDAYVNWDTGLLGQGFNAMIGRVNHSTDNPYILKRQNSNRYIYDNDRWNNGNYIFDGAILGFDWGNVGLTVFGGSHDEIDADDAGHINPIMLGSGDVSALLGVQLNFSWGDDEEEMEGEDYNGGGNGGNLELAYVWLDSNTLTNAVFGDFNRMNVYGADLGWNFGNIELWGSYAATTLSENTDEVLDEDNAAYHGHIAYNANNWGLGGGYRVVEGNFLAPGDWGHVGTWWNPTNVSGFYGQAWFNVGGNVKLTGWYEQLEGHDNAGGFGNGANLLGEDDDVTVFGGALNFDINNNWSAEVGGYNAMFNIGDGDYEPCQTWYWAGFRRDIGEGSFLSVGYIYSDVMNDGMDVVLIPQAVGGGGFSGDFKGGLFTTQLTIKF